MGRSPRTAVTPGLPGTSETEWIETVPANASGFTSQAHAFLLDVGSPLGFGATGGLPIVVP